MVTGTEAIGPERSRMTIGGVLAEATEQLTRSGVGEPRLNAEILLASSLGVDRLDLSVRLRERLPNWPEEEFHARIRRRQEREPLQYILGWTEFMGLRFTVDRSVLIPRPETELLVETAVAILSGSPASHRSVLDVGTGSGNIALSIARLVPDARVLAIDISREALSIARQNREQLHLGNVEFQHADAATFSYPRPFDLLVANPPYVSISEFAELEPEISRFEPRIATTDEGDGLRFIRLLIGQAATLVKPGGRLLIELGFGQAHEAISLGNRQGLANVSVFNDLSGVPRLFSAAVPGMT